MRKAERLLKLLTLLQGRRTAVTATVLAQRLDVSERTIYRDIQSLQLSGVAVEGEAGVGYLLADDSLLPPLMFDEEELESLILGVRMVQVWGDEALGDAAERALDKIRAIIPARLKYLRSIAHETLLVPDYEHREAIPHSQDLREAIKRRRVVQLSYQAEDGQRSRRSVWPLALVYWGRTWTLIAWCELREDYRTFRVDRIRGFAEQALEFPERDDRCLDHYLENQD